ncbi:MAG: hypothetical protein J7L20_03970, partial [Thermoplasmata archaeon]|nr:hypothetical protein [Thermoplasmata archaeon]
IQIQRWLISRGQDEIYLLQYAVESLSIFPKEQLAGDMLCPANYSTQQFVTKRSKSHSHKLSL